MSRNILLVLVFITFISVFIIFTGIISFFLILPNKKDAIPESSLYQFQEFDSSSNTISNGFVTLNKELSDDEFISYHNEDLRSTIIISEFSDSQYECSGSCFCSDIQRRSTSVLTRSLYILFTALSSSLAFKIAEKSFHDQCLHQFSTTCTEENIQSEVQSCSEKEANESEEEEEYAEYFCTGHCLPKIFRTASTIEGQKKYFKREGNCEELTTSGNVRIRRTIGNKQEKRTRVRTGEIKVYPSRYQHLNFKVASGFMSSQLTPFCREMSGFEYHYLYPNKDRQGYRRGGSACVSTGGSLRFSGGKVASGRTQRENVRCKLISENKHVEFNRKLHEKKE